MLDKTDEFCESIELENLENISNNEHNTEIEQLVKEIKKIKTFKNDTSVDCSKKRSSDTYTSIPLIFYLTVKLLKTFQCQTNFYKTFTIYTPTGMLFIILT